MEEDDQKWKKMVQMKYYQGTWLRFKDGLPDIEIPGRTFWALAVLSPLSTANVEFPLLQVLRSVMSCIVPPILVKPHFMFDGSVCRIHITATVVSLSSSRVPFSRVGCLRA